MTEPILKSAPLLPPTAAFAAGIAAASWWPVPPVALLGAGAGVLLPALLVARRMPQVALALVLAGATLLGALRAATPPLPDDHIARRPPATSVTVEARLDQEPVRWAPDRTRLLLEVLAVQAGLERLPASGRVQLTVYGEIATPLGELCRPSLSAW